MGADNAWVCAGKWMEMGLVLEGRGVSCGCAL